MIFPHVCLPLWTVVTATLVLVATGLKAVLEFAPIVGDQSWFQRVVESGENARFVAPGGDDHHTAARTASAASVRKARLRRRFTIGA